MKKLIIALAIIGITTIGLFLATKNVAAEPADFSRVYMLKGGGKATPDAQATTTSGVTYLAAGATTTFPFSTGKADMINLDIRMTASTSAGTLIFTYETSNDTANCNTDPNLCNWSLPSIITSQVISSTTPTWTWRPDGELNATSSLSFLINPTYSKYIRVKASVTGSAAALWISATRKTQDNTFTGN